MIYDPISRHGIQKIRSGLYHAISFPLGAQVFPRISRREWHSRLLPPTACQKGSTYHRYFNRRRLWFICGSSVTQTMDLMGLVWMGAVSSDPPTLRNRRRLGSLQNMINLMTSKQKVILSHSLLIELSYSVFLVPNLIARPDQILVRRRCI